MTINFNQFVTKGAVNDFSAEQTDEKYSVTLAAGTAKTVTVPSRPGIGLSITGPKFLMVINVDPADLVWFSVNGTAVTATGLSNFTKTSSEIVKNGIGRYVAAGDVVSFKTDETTAVVNVCFYYLSNG